MLAVAGANSCPVDRAGCSLPFVTRSRRRREEKRQDMAADLSRVPAEVRERIRELEGELKEGESEKGQELATIEGCGG